MRHQNTGACSGCVGILDRYPGFHEDLRIWFHAVQIENPDFHVSCAGRGRVEQEAAFYRGASKAHYGRSAHNWNAALDAFQLKDGKALWERPYFEEVVGLNLYPRLKWYGAKDAEFYELPHIEIADWRALSEKGALQLVEP